LFAYVSDKLLVSRAVVEGFLFVGGCLELFCFICNSKSPGSDGEEQMLARHGRSILLFECKGWRAKKYYTWRNKKAKDDALSERGQEYLSLLLDPATEASIASS